MGFWALFILSRAEVSNQYKEKLNISKLILKHKVQNHLKLIGKNVIILRY